ncbi:hypothetical protein N9O51_02055 [Saprospiraceae bacterium]|jgi:hypothetical protein|nr:hypothetical protein [Saprospiraceae bacterium]
MLLKINKLRYTYEMTFEKIGKTKKITGYKFGDRRIDDMETTTTSYVAE